MQFLKQNSGTGGGSGVTISVGPCLDSAGAEYTGLVIGDLTLTKNGTSAAMAANATLTHTSNGHYDLVTIGNNADTLGRLRIRCNKSGYQIPPLEFMVLPAMIYDSLVAATDRLDVNVTHIADTSQTARDIGASVLLSNGTAPGQLDFTSGVVKANVTQNAGSAITASGGRQEVNVSHWSGSSLLPIRGKVIHVATSGNGGNDSNAGTAAAPKLTLNGAIAIASPGDKIEVGAGTFSGAVSNTVDRLTIVGQGKDQTIITHNSGKTLTNTGDYFDCRYMSVRTTSTTLDTNQRAISDEGTFKSQYIGLHVVGWSDGIYLDNSYDALVSGCRIETAWDGIQTAPSFGTRIEGCYITGGGEYGSAVEARGVCAGFGVVIDRCLINMTRTVVSTSTGRAIAVQSDAAHVVVRDSLLIAKDEVDESVANAVAFAGGVATGATGVLENCYLSTVHTNANKAKDIDASGTAAYVVVAGTRYSTSKVLGASNIYTNDGPLRPTTNGRSLDVSSGGEAGIDWANVGSPTTTLNLSGTTTKNTTDIATTLADATNGLAAIKTVAEAAQTAAETAGDAAGNARTEATAAKVAAQSADTKLDSKPTAAEVWGSLTSGMGTNGSIGKLLTTNVDAKISEVEGGGGGVTDTQHEQVPPGRKFKLVPTEDEGWVGEAELSIMADLVTTLSIDFEDDLPVGGFIRRIESIDVVSGDGISLTQFGRDYSEAKFRAIGSPGRYEILAKVTYNTGAAGGGVVILNIPEPPDVLGAGTPGSASEIELTDVAQEAIPTERVFVLRPTPRDGLVAEAVKVLRVGVPATTFAIDFAADLPANGYVATFAGLQVVPDDGGIEVTLLERSATRAVFRAEGLTPGDYELAAAVVYHNGDGQRGLVRFKVVG